MNNLIAKLKVARTIGNQMFGSQDFLIVVDFSNGLVQPSQNAHIWEDDKYSYLPNVCSDEDMAEQFYVDYCEYLDVTQITA